MSMPNEDYQDIENVCTAMCCVRSSWLKLKPERLPDVVRVENLVRGKGIQSDSQDDLRPNAIRASQQRYGRQWFR
jgi:hypothetical protein